MRIKEILKYVGIVMLIRQVALKTDDPPLDIVYHLEEILSFEKTRNKVLLLDQVQKQNIEL